MGKIVMPKNSALLNEIESALQVYYEADGWLSNEDYKSKLIGMIGNDQYQSSYTKKAQITSYFGFTVWEDLSNPRSLRKITDSGKQMYEAIKNNNEENIQKILMESLERTTFGRNNFGCPESNSDVEPPSLFIRACLELGYLTYREFAFLLWKLGDVGGSFTDSIEEIKNYRNTSGLDLPPEAKKYTDAKPIMILERWGFLQEITESTSEKRITISHSVLDKYSSRLRNLKIYNVDMNVSSYGADDKFDDINSIRKKGGTNIILYGVPGAGKSWTIKKEYVADFSFAERILFHPDYSYSDFVGQLLPRLNKDNIVEYEFVPGPFTNILKKAITDPSHMYYLIIEELNRGNAPAIFGDIFQLLDRDDEGNSEYYITNKDIAKKVFSDENHHVFLPSNLSIICTMNTSDQNVFTLDTAFQRRWTMRLIQNIFHDEEKEIALAKTNILDSNVCWETFITEINKMIIENTEATSTEDKRIGTHFIKKEDLLYRYNDRKQNGKFVEKVIKYLWDDVFKYSREVIFDVEKFKSLDEVIVFFIQGSGDKRFLIFKENIFNRLVKTIY